MPSRSEGQCIAALEALACGRPVVAANLGGFSDYIIDGFNGILFEPESTESLAFAIEKAFKMNWNYRAIADSVKTKYGWEKSIKKLIDVIFPKR
jgi:glycosyltransferase involved in cell wall biosynthesis